MYLVYFIVFELFSLISSDDSGQNIENIDIKPGIIKYIINKGVYRTFQFTAIDDGYYLITFDNVGMIIEATGDVHQDISIFEKEGLRTGAYAQNFTKGDYFKMTYPYLSDATYNEHAFKIEKIDTDINLRLLTEGKYCLFENIYLTNCSKPIYILMRNPSRNEYSTNNNIFYSKSFIHSGEFFASYQTTDYSPKNDGKLLNSFTPFNLTELTILPNKFCFYVIELKCKTPGMLSFIFNGEHNEISSEGYFTYYSFTNKGITQNRFNLSHNLGLDHTGYIGTYYLEIFNIHGCANFNMNSIGGKIYECEDFYLSTNFNTLRDSKSFPMNVITKPFWFASVYHAGEEDGFILEKEKEEYFCKVGGMRIIIPINTKKRSIKIKSSIPKFFWSLDFTQKNYSYLPVPSGSSLNYVYGNYIYIRNPNSFTQKKNTNYNWYIIVYHFNKTESPSFSYEYTNKENEEDEGYEDSEIPSDNNKNFFQNPIFWVIIIIILIVCIAVIFIYIKVFKKSNSSGDNILKDKEFNKLVDI